MSDAPAVETSQVEATGHPIFKEVEMKFKAPSQKAVAAAKTEGKELTQRPAFNVRIPQYTIASLMALMSANEKVAQLVTSLANNEIVAEARAQVVDDEKPVNSDAELDKSKLTLEAIANLSAAERASRVEISKEELAAFAALFETVMPAITEYDPSGIKIIAQALKSRLAAWKQRPEILEKVKDLLKVFAQGIEPADLETYEPVLSYLDSVCSKYIEKPQIDKLSALLLS